MDSEELISKLNDEITWAHHDFELYKKLFFGSPKTNKIINHTANNFFFRLEIILADRCIINISKLTDPYDQRGNKNLSISLLKVIGEKEEWPFIDKINESLVRINELVLDIRKHRNKSKSHTDIKTLKEPWTLESITLKQIEAVLLEMGKLLNSYYLQTHGYKYDWYPKSPGNVDNLLAFLEIGLEHKKNME